MAVVPLRRAVRRSAPAEVKYVDFNGDVYLDNNATQNLSIVHLSGLAQGVAGWQRIGRRVNPKFIQLTFTVLPYNIPATSSQMKIALVRDRHPDGGVPAYLTMFSSVNQAGTLSSDCNSFINPDQRDRFSILYQKEFAVGHVAATTGDIQRISQTSDQVSGRFYKKLTFPLEYRGATSSIADVQANALYLVAFSQDIISASQMWTCHFSSRIAYTD